MVFIPEGEGFKGRKVRIRWRGELILGVRERSLTLAGERVDVTSDEDDGWRRLAVDDGAAQDNVDFTCSGVVKSQILREDWFTRVRDGELIIEYPTGHNIRGTAVLVNYTDTGPYNDALTFEAVFQFSGPVSYDYIAS